MALIRALILIAYKILAVAGRSIEKWFLFFTYILTHYRPQRVCWYLFYFAFFFIIILVFLREIIIQMFCQECSKCAFSCQGDSRD